MNALIAPTPSPSGETTSHSTRPANDASQVAGYPARGKGNFVRAFGAELGWEAA